MITDDVLKEAACEFDTAMLDSISPADIPEHTFSQGFEADFKKLSKKTNWLLANKLLTTVAILSIVCICVLSLGVGITHAAIQLNKHQQMGQYYAESNKKIEAGETGKVLAKYEDMEITSLTVEYHHKMNTILYVPKYETDMDIVNRLIRGRMIQDESERLGLSATQEEIDALIENTCRAYEMPDGKEMMDDYLETAGITFEEYLALLKEQAPDMITRNKLKHEYARQFCEENGLEYRPGNSTPEIDDAVEEKLNALFEQNKYKIEYFIDTEE